MFLLSVAITAFPGVLAQQSWLVCFCCPWQSLHSQVSLTQQSWLVCFCCPWQSLHSQVSLPNSLGWCVSAVRGNHCIPRCPCPTVLVGVFLLSVAITAFPGVLDPTVLVGVFLLSVAITAFPGVLAQQSWLVCFCCPWQSLHSQVSLPNSLGWCVSAVRGNHCIPRCP